MDAGQEGAVKVSCCFLSLPENYTLFSLGRAAQHVDIREPSGKLVVIVTKVILGNSGSFIKSATTTTLALNRNEESLSLPHGTK